MLNIEYLGEKCQHGIGYTRMLPYKQGGSLENAPFIVITALRECAVSCLHKFIFRKNTSFQKEAILISQFFHHNVKSAKFNPYTSNRQCYRRSNQKSEHCSWWSLELLTKWPWPWFCIRSIWMWTTGNQQPGTKNQEPTTRNQSPHEHS